MERDDLQKSLEELAKAIATSLTTSDKFCEAVGQIPTASEALIEMAKQNDCALLEVLACGTAEGKVGNVNEQRNYQMEEQ